MKTRWLTNDDLDTVMTIEKESFDCPWTRDEMKHMCLSENRIGYVAEDYPKHILGYMIYNLSDNFVKIESLAVHPSYRRKGVGSFLIRSQQIRLPEEGRTSIVAFTSELNLNCQLFLKELGFRAVNIHHKYYDGGLDAYEFRWNCCVNTKSHVT